jgi:hypothetical protein
MNGAADDRAVDPGARVFLEALPRAHIPHRMGLALPETFARAGLPAPELRLECAMFTGEPLLVWGWSDVVAGLVPVMEQLGVAAADEVQPGRSTNVCSLNLLPPRSRDRSPGRRCLVAHTAIAKARNSVRPSHRLSVLSRLTDGPQTAALRP